MTDLDEAILNAWQKLRPRILSDPHELARRLSRRRNSLLSRPPRAWCLAIRASDHRITPPHCPITDPPLDPSHANLHSRPDPIWGCMWEYLPDLIPDNFEQPIIRRPFFHARKSRRGTLFPNPKFDPSRHPDDRPTSIPPYISAD